MTKRIFRRHFLTTSLAASFLSSAAFANAPDRSWRPVLRGGELYKRAIPTVDAVLGEARLRGDVAFVVADTQTGKVIESLSPAKAKPPASVTKVITALYALDTLGQEHRFDTSVIATGGIVNGEIQGDLIFAGGGDPTLSTDVLAQMAVDLKARGITGVKGGFKVYHGALPSFDRIDAAQPEQVGYNPGISGLALNYNRVHFEWRRENGDYSVEMDARTKTQRPSVVMATMQIVNRETPIYGYSSAPRRDHWTVARGALGNGGSRWLPVRKPAIYVADVFGTVARANGIRLKRAELVNKLPQGDVIVRHQSAPLRRIAREMLRFSTNLTAEMLGLAATQKRGGATASLKQSADQMNVWAKEKLAMNGSSFVDHSGLGDASLITANDMVQVLLAVKGQGLRDILKPIAMRDAKRKVIKNHPINVHAKTGTLNFVSSLAGYFTAPNGTEMAFAIFAGDEERRETISRAERESPQGGRKWNRRAKAAQQALIERWGFLYGAE